MHFPPSVRFLPSAAVIAILACSAEVSAPTVRYPVATVTLLSGQDQTVRRGSPLPQPIVVRVDTAGVPAANVSVNFVIVADGSPGPNETWFAVTDNAGVASGNGPVTNTGVRRATVTINYLICTAKGFKGCSEEKTGASASTTVTVVE